MIEPDETVFPNNAVDLIMTRAPGAIDPDVTVVARPLRETDPDQSIGVWGTLWEPRQDSYEFQGGALDPRSAQEPTLQVYSITVQAMIKSADVELGLMTHSVLSKKVRGMLYYDRPLRVGFSALASQMFGVTEKLTRWGIRSQRYNSSEVLGDWIFVSSLDLWIETETV